MCPDGLVTVALPRRRVQTLPPRAGVAAGLCSGSTGLDSAHQMTSVSQLIGQSGDCWLFMGQFGDARVVLVLLFCTTYCLHTFILYCTRLCSFF